ncbi:MAG: FAD/NAD(P)-binding protein [Verrucomicrobia bacterium]|nr:FAD/NAD(P)-binding protein [Verrucomicrobiota bacterium]
MQAEQVVYSRPVDVAIVGAGFSGSMVAIHLAHTLQGLWQIALIEKRRQAGPGVAYSTNDPLHLLNVPVGRMGAFTEKPRDFFEWLKQHPELVSSYGLDPLGDGAFVPRRLYGIYLARLVQRFALQSGRVHRFEQEAVDLEEAADGSFRVFLRNNTTIYAKKVVLALGNFPPGDPVVSDQRFHRSRSYLNDPWSLSTLKRLSEPGDVLILGSGLTALDLILSLSEKKHSGAIYVLSRGGLFPERHAVVEPYAFHLSDPRRIRSVRSLLRAIRNEVSLAGEMNIGWRSVIDALRPHTQAIWQQLDLDERRRFFRHVRPYWECHRHRAAPKALDRMEALQNTGRLRCCQGRVERIFEDKNAMFITFRNRSGISTTLRVSLVVNCTGPECNYHKLRDPLVFQLFLRGLARPDPLFIGFDVSDTGQLFDAAGRVVPNLFTMGSPQKGRLLETTAVPELRQQALELATRLTDDLRMAARRAIEELPAGHLFEI